MASEPVMSRVAAISFLCAAACAHDHALNRGEVGAMKNASPAISPWSGPVADPIAGASSDAPAASPDAPVLALVDQVHGMVAQVFAARGADKINTASGVLAGGGLVLTDLRALFFEAPDGSLQVATEIAVLTSQGAFPARIVGSVFDTGVAVLELPELARELEGPPLAEGSADVGDLLLAIRASKEGSSLLFEVIGFSVAQTAGNPLRLRAAPGVPINYAGAPVFDAAGALAGLLVGPTGQDIIFVPPARLLQIITAVHPPATQVDDHT
jgi:hypothetical protein